METIDRYVYAVTHRLPEKQRNDVKRELHGLIEDLLEERIQGRKASQEDIDQILLELGNPRMLAKEYGGTERYLIGPDLFDSYLTVLKIVGGVLLTLVSIGYLVRLIISPTDITAQLVDYFTALFEVVLQVFTSVTASFGIAEYFSANSGKVAKTDWKPADLEPIPHHKKQIPLSEPLFGIGLSILFLILCLFPDRIVLIRVAPGVGVNRFFIFNLGTMRHFLPYIVGFFGIGVVRESLKLVKRRWTPRLAVAVLICNGIALLLAMQVLPNPAFWNQDFINQLLQTDGLNITSSSQQTLESIWHVLTIRSIYFVGISLAIDTIRGFFRALWVK